MPCPAAAVTESYFGPFLRVGQRELPEESTRCFTPPDLPRLRLVVEAFDNRIICSVPSFLMHVTMMMMSDINLLVQYVGTAACRLYHGTSWYTKLYQLEYKMVPQNILLDQGVAKNAGGYMREMCHGR